MKKILFSLLIACGIVMPSYADVFTGDGQITNIRQSNSTTLQVNHTAVVANNCATKLYGVAIQTSHPNFKNIYAAILTAKAMGSNTQFALYDNQCVDGFGLINIFTIK